MATKTATNRLRVLRAERDITQMDLALKARISHNRYWRIEAGYVTATDEELARIARALKATPQDVYPSLASTPDSGADAPVAAS